MCNEAPAPVQPTVLVTLPPALVKLFPGSVAQLEVSAFTVDEVVDRLDCHWPGMRDRICDSTPAIRRHMNVFVEGRRARLETPLGPGAEVVILTAISGG